MIDQTFVQSVMLYGAENWPLGRHNADKLLATKMDFWQSSKK